MIPRRLVLVCAFALAAACARRYPTDAGGDRPAVAGIPLALGSGVQPLPPGTRVEWDFGDGTRAEGREARHAWPRAGGYRVRLTVTDAKGVRVDEARIRVARRPPAAAVPPGARAALILERPFARAPRHVALAEQILGPGRTSAALAAAEAFLGFNPAQPESVEAAGIDPDEGLALAWTPADRGGWLIVGVFDERAALEAARSALARRSRVTFTAGLGDSTLARVGDATLLLAARGGYLYVHLPDADGGDERQALATLDTVGEAGLTADPLFARARAATRGDDLFLYARGKDLGPRERLPARLKPVRDGVRSFAAGATLEEKRVVARAMVDLDPEASRVFSSLFPPTRPPELARRATADAVGYAALSIDPGLLEELAGSSDNSGRAELDATLVRVLGLDLAGVLRLVTGELEAALFFDPAAMFRGSLSIAEPPRPDVTLVAAARVKDPEAARLAVERAGEAIGRMKARQPIADLPVDLNSQALRVVDDLALAQLGSGDALARSLSEDPGRTRLVKKLEAALPGGALAGGRQLLYLDVAAFVDSLREPVIAQDADPVQAMVMRAVLQRLFEDRDSAFALLVPVKDLSFDVKAEPGGVAATATLRLR